jgi:hypothetical protein
MKPRERRIYHRDIERRCVQRIRFAIKTRNYAEVARHAVEAAQQRAAGDCAASEEHSDKIKRIQASQRQGKAT